MDERPFVLGLAGTPGAGKTTLTTRLRERRPRARVVYYDKYQPITRMSEAQVRDWFARGGDPNEVDHHDLVLDLRRETRGQHGAIARPLLIFETPFGRLHRETGAFIDFLVWIDTPLDLALSRAILAFTRIARAETSPKAARDFILWQEQYMTNYPLVRDMYQAQRERIAPTADLVIDGTRATDALADLVEAALAEQGIRG